MGRKIDALLGRSFKLSKFKPLVSLAITRLAVLKKLRQVKCSQATSDVVELLNLGHHERALLRVEHVIKERNMLDAYVMVEGYCNLLLERLHLIEQEKICPDELKEAVAGLSYASSRCGDFPELQAIRTALVSRYGKDFVARAIELRNDCGVSTTLIQKLSTRMPSLDGRMSALKNIAAEHSIVLQLGESTAPTEGTKKQDHSGPVGLEIPNEIAENDEKYSTKNKKYKDVADAAQAAFESAAYAAEAARAAVELSRFDSGDPSSPNPRRRKISDDGGVVDSFDDSNAGLGSRGGGNHVSDLGDSKSHKGTQETDQKTSELKGSVSSSSDSEGGDIINASEMSPEALKHLEELLTKDIVIDLSEDEKNDTEGVASQSVDDPAPDVKQNSAVNKLPWGSAHKQNQARLGASSIEFGRPVTLVGKGSRYGIGTGKGKTIENQKLSSVRTRR